MSLPLRDPVDTLLDGCEDLQSHGNRPGLDRVGDHKRPKEIVPMIADGYEAEGDIGRLGERHEDAPKNLQRVRAFKPCGLFEFLRDALECLTEQNIPNAEAR